MSNDKEFCVVYVCHLSFLLLPQLTLVFSASCITYGLIPNVSVVDIFYCHFYQPSFSLCCCDADFADLGLVLSSNGICLNTQLAVKVNII